MDSKIQFVRANMISREIDGTLKIAISKKFVYGDHSRTRLDIMRRWMSAWKRRTYDPWRNRR